MDKIITVLVYFMSITFGLTQIQSLLVTVVYYVYCDRVHAWINAGYAK